MDDSDLHSDLHLPALLRRPSPPSTTSLYPALPAHSSSSHTPSQQDSEEAVKRPLLSPSCARRSYRTLPPLTLLSVLFVLLVLLFLMHLLSVASLVIGNSRSASIIVSLTVL